MRGWRELLELRRGPLEDPEGQREALEALLEVDPVAASWRVELIDLCIVEGDEARAGELIVAEIGSLSDSHAKAEMMVRAARIAMNGADDATAQADLERAVELAPDLHCAWEALREVYERGSKESEAIAAQIRAAETSPTASEQAERLFEVARTAQDGSSERGPACEHCSTKFWLSFPIIGRRLVAC